MKITKRQLKQIIKEELLEMRAFDPTQEMGAQGLSRDDTLYYEPEGDHDPQSGRQDPRLVDRMKTLYGIVIDKRPEFELTNSVSGTEKESVTLFIDAYNAGGQQGMSNVHKIISAMEELSRGRSNY
jgi:hypothetical protein